MKFIKANDAEQDDLVRVVNIKYIVSMKPESENVTRIYLHGHSDILVRHNLDDLIKILEKK